MTGESAREPDERPEAAASAGASLGESLPDEAAPPAGDAEVEPARPDDALNDDQADDDQADDAAPDDDHSDEAAPGEAAPGDDEAGADAVGEESRDDEHEPGDSETVSVDGFVVDAVLAGDVFADVPLALQPASGPGHADDEAATTSDAADPQPPIEQPPVEQPAVEQAPIEQPPGPDAAPPGSEPDAASPELDAPAATTVTTTATTTADPAPQGAWRVLGRALAPRATRAQVTAGVLCALLGFALVVQVRQNDTTNLSGLRQADLVRILDETTERGDALRREVADLRSQRDKLASGSDREAAALESLRRAAVTQGILAGRLPAQGPGVRVVLVDPDGRLQPITMLNMLEELRNAGAEAIQLNDRRITASSAFTGSRGEIVLDGVALEAPYTWLAIGDPETIAIALQIPAGAMATVRGNGASGAVTQLDEVQVTAVRDLPEPQFATPVPPSGE